MPDSLDQTLAALLRFEGSIPWMYLDTAGKVTVGAGLMLADAPSAVRLAFTMDGRPATEAEIEAEYARVEALPMGRPALFYRGNDKPELPGPEIEALLHTVLTGFEGELRRRLPQYDSMPGHARVALLEMIYNLGPAGLFNGFPRMMQAVEAGDWTAAAACCERRNVGPKRNAWARAMWLGNTVQTIKAVAESGWKRLGFGLVGLCAAGAAKLRRR